MTRELTDLHVRVCEGRYGVLAHRRQVSKQELMIKGEQLEEGQEGLAHMPRRASTEQREYSIQFTQLLRSEE